MGVSKVAVYTNCDVATIVWETDNIISGCRGFALKREVSGAAGDATNDYIHTWVGFAGQSHTQGESEPSDVWPIQRYIWSDYLVSKGQKVRYRVIPMIGAAGNLQAAPDSECSSWTKWVDVDTGQSPGFLAYFNRGIVPAQFLARQAGSSAEFKQMLSQNIKDPFAKNRIFLSGPLRPALLTLLQQAKQQGSTIYVALYELNDPELIPALTAFGANCNLILGSGAYKAANKKKGTPAVPDENAAVRATLKQTSIHVVDRLVKSPHFAHNKFVVFCDGSGTATSVWTGSTNWTMTGLCTQVNNGILITSAKLAKAYKARWDALKAAENDYPKSLAQSGSTAATDAINGSAVTAWNVPCLKYVDLNDASKYIAAAQQGVLFLMFNPGSGDGKKRAFSLLQDIEQASKRGLFTHGVVNQEQNNGEEATVQLTSKGKELPPVSVGEITPKALTDAAMNWFHPEYVYNLVMIHSKVVVVDPFGPKPVVMTGSHNLGPKASADNDDNLVIIENAPGLAKEYAVNIMNVYGHYKWLYNAYIKSKGGTASSDSKVKKAATASPQYDGNLDSDQWQQWYTSGPNRLEIEFWLGKAPLVGGGPPASQSKSHRTMVPNRPKKRPRNAKKAAIPKNRSSKKATARTSKKRSPQSHRGKRTSTRSRRQS
jgi:phosphatidylserine/phosphatidylglycerophosphate/cardiolipin synthase-like enzyme